MSETPIVDNATPVRKKPLNLALILALAALGLSAWQLYSTQQQLTATRTELARRLADSHNSAKDMQGATQQAINTVRSSDARLLALESRVNEAAGQYATLSSMYSELNKSRSDWQLAEIEHALTIASQQLQLAGNVPAAISALQAVDTRLEHNDQPQLLGLKKAVSKDLETLKELPYLDSIGLTVKIDRLMLAVDAMPLAVDGNRLDSSTHAARVASASAPLWERLIGDISRSLGEMVRIRRMDKPEALLLSPEQAFFLRENLKMRLLDARLALLQRDGNSFKADLTAAQAYTLRYYDRDAPATKQWLSLLAELGQAPLGVTLPDLAGSLKAVRDAQGNPGE
ncbi:uroporphyrinogen-III C-methyltransferase [Paludibacterium yongneupense]|uniref:uroporphyrinogen-III C-methyltransferase n=1 Tax=Paludibacterium yongneupense TaxID=400061 RepID=UPI0003FFC5D4|nr:uroporphyrinogen-III C-methyltransferase [Paludibacterium yongneupense]